MRLRQLFEEPRTAVMAFGRMNPPTIGHQKLVDKIKSLPGDHYVFLSQSQKPKTDPLAFEDKLRYAKFFFPAINIGHPDVKTIIQALSKISELGYKNLIYVAGSDRVASFEELINKYNNQPDKEGKVAYAFDNIQVVSAGERDPDADGAEGMSASKMRQAAADNDLESFKQGVPRQEIADEMFAAVRQGMGIKDAVPAESITETVEEAEWYVLTANGGDRLTGPLDNNSAQQQAMVYPAKPPQIGPAPEGFKTVIAQSKSNSLNMAMTKAQLQVKKIYARQFGNNVQNLRITMNEIKYGGRAVDANGKNYIATVSAHIKIQSQTEEASKEQEDEFHQKLDKLVHMTFGPGPHEKKKKEDEVEENFSPMAWVRDKLSSDPQYKAWRQIYRQDPDRAARTFRQKHKEFLAAYQAAGNKSIEEGDLVIDKGSLRRFLAQMITDAIAKEDDVEKLSRVLKILVGKEIKTRSNRAYTITDEDVIEACKSHKRKRRG